MSVIALWQVHLLQIWLLFSVTAHLKVLGSLVDPQFAPQWRRDRCFILSLCALSRHVHITGPRHRSRDQYVRRVAACSLHPSCFRCFGPVCLGKTRRRPPSLCYLSQLVTTCDRHTQPGESSHCNVQRDPTEPHLDGNSVGKPQLDVFFICLMRRFYQHMVSLMCVTGFLLPLCLLAFSAFIIPAVIHQREEQQKGHISPFMFRLLLWYIKGLSWRIISRYRWRLLGEA